MKAGVVVAAAAAIWASCSGASALEAADQNRGNVVYICDRDDLTRADFERRHGRMEFVKATVVRSGTQENWSSPRCISESEYRRLRRMNRAERAPIVQAQR